MTDEKIGMTEHITKEKNKPKLRKLHAFLLSKRKVLNIN